MLFVGGRDPNFGFLVGAREPSAETNGKAQSSGWAVELGCKVKGSAEEQENERQWITALEGSPPAGEPLAGMEQNQE